MADQQQQQQHRPDSTLTSASNTTHPGSNSTTASASASAPTTPANPTATNITAANPAAGSVRAPTATTTSTRSFFAHHARVITILYDAKRRQLNPIPASVARLANDYPYANAIATGLVNQARSLVSSSSSQPLWMNSGRSSSGHPSLSAPAAAASAVAAAPHAVIGPTPPVTFSNGVLSMYAFPHHHHHPHPYPHAHAHHVIAHPHPAQTRHHQQHLQQHYQQHLQQHLQHIQQLVPPSGRVLFIRRISVQSVARFLGVIGGLMSFLRLWIVMSLALARTIATLAEIPQVEQTVKTIARQSITRASDNHFFNWLVQVLSHTDPSFMLEQRVNFAGLNINSSLYLSIFLSMPLVEGALCYLIGMVIAISINIGLSFSNGIRIENDNF